MTVAAQRYPGGRPMAADAPHQSADVAGDLGAGRCLAGSQQHRHRATCGGVVDMDRQEAALAIMAVPERELLRAVDDVDGVVDVERHHRRRRGIAPAVDVYQRAGEPHQFACGRRILPARHRRLTGKADRSVRQFAKRQFEPRIMAQRVEIVGVLVAAGDRQDAGAQNAIKAVDHAALIAGIGNAASKSSSDPEPSLGLRQKQHSAIRCQSAAIQRDGGCVCCILPG